MADAGGDGSLQPQPSPSLGTSRWAAATAKVLLTPRCAGRGGSPRERAAAASVEPLITDSCHPETRLLLAAGRDGQETTSGCLGAPGRVGVRGAGWALATALGHGTAGTATCVEPAAVGPSQVSALVPAFRLREPFCPGRLGLVSLDAVREERKTTGPGGELPSNGRYTPV